jgi:hypothetical protein
MQPEKNRAASICLQKQVDIFTAKIQTALSTIKQIIVAPYV